MFIPENYRLTHNTICYIGRDYRLIGYNPAYLQFAAANGCENIEQNWGIGNSVLDCTPPILRGLLKKAYDRAFAGETVEYEYNCHSPEKFRRYVMRLIPQPDGNVVAEHALLFEQEHQDVLDLGLQAVKAGYQRADGIIVQCCNCRKLRSLKDSLRWDLVRSLIASAAGFTISHGICPVCAEQLYPGMNLEE